MQSTVSVGPAGPAHVRPLELKFSSPEVAAAQPKMAGRAREAVSHFSPQRFRDLAMEVPLGTLLKLRLVYEKRLKQGPAEDLANDELARGNDLPLPCQNLFRTVADHSHHSQTVYPKDMRQLEHLAPLLGVLLRLAPGGLPSHASVVTGLQVLAESVSDPQMLPDLMLWREGCRVLATIRCGLGQAAQ